jgi:hypothetical protein
MWYEMWSALFHNTQINRMQYIPAIVTEPVLLWAHSNNYSQVQSLLAPAVCWGRIHKCYLLWDLG